MRVKSLDARLLVRVVEGRRGEEIKSVVEKIENLDDDGHVVVLINRRLLLASQ